VFEASRGLAVDKRQYLGLGLLRQGFGVEHLLVAVVTHLTVDQLAWISCQRLDHLQSGE
jgi:hypothetical protein